MLIYLTIARSLGPITTMDDRLLRPNPTYACTERPPFDRSPEARHISYPVGLGHDRRKSDVNWWPRASPPAPRWAVRPDAIVVQGRVAKLNSAPILNKFHQYSPSLLNFQPTYSFIFHLSIAWFSILVPCIYIRYTIHFILNKYR